MEKPQYLDPEFVKRGPKILHEFQRNVLQRRVVQSLGVAVQQFKAQQGISIPQIEGLPNTPLQEHMEAARAAENQYSYDPDSILEAIAAHVGCNPEDVDLVRFYESSATVCLNSPSFKVYWEWLEPEEKDSLPIGFTDIPHQIEVNGNILPISFEDTDRAASRIPVPTQAYIDKKMRLVSRRKSGEDEKLELHQSNTSKHEHLHTQYRHIHPKSEKPAYGSNKRITSETASAVSESSPERFQKLLNQVSDFYLTLFLNELSSAALDRSKHTYNQFFQNGGHYSKVLRKRLQLIRKNLPASGPERLTWEGLIKDTYDEMQGKANYIFTEYNYLANNTTLSDDELVAHVQFLTPENGFIIKAYTDDNPTKEKLEQWKQQYEIPVKPSSGTNVDYWAQVIESTLEPEDTYRWLRRYIPSVVGTTKSEYLARFGLDHTAPGTKHMTLEEFKNFALNGMSERFQNRMDQVNQLLESPVFPDNEKEVLRRKLLVPSFDTEFLKTYRDYIFSMYRMARLPEMLFTVSRTRRDEYQEYLKMKDNDRDQMTGFFFLLNDIAEEIKTRVWQGQTFSMEEVIQSCQDQFMEKGERIKMRLEDLGHEPRATSHGKEDLLIFTISDMDNSDLEKMGKARSYEVLMLILRALFHTRITHQANSEDLEDLKVMAQKSSNQEILGPFRHLLINGPEKYPLLLER